MKKCKYRTVLELAHTTLSQNTQPSRRSGLVLSCRRRRGLSGLFVRNPNIGVLGKILSHPFLGKSIRRWDLDWTGATFLYLATSRQSVTDLPTALRHPLNQGIPFRFRHESSAWQRSGWPLQSVCLSIRLFVGSSCARYCFGRKGQCPRLILPSRSRTRTTGTGPVSSQHSSSYNCSCLIQFT